MQALRMATMAYDKGLGLNYYAEDVSIVKDTITIYPDASVDGHIYDLLRDMAKVIEPGFFAQELSRLTNVKVVPSLHDAVATLEPLLAKIGTNQMVKLTAMELVLSELASKIPEDSNSFTILYAQLSDQGFSIAEANNIISMLPNLSTDQFFYLSLCDAALKSRSPKGALSPRQCSANHVQVDDGVVKGRPWRNILERLLVRSWAAMSRSDLLARSQ